MVEGKKFLLETADSLGIQCAPASANFVLLRVDNASEVRMELLTRHGLCVRDCSSFGLPDYIRVGVRVMADNRRLAAALSQVMARERVHG